MRRFGQEKKEYFEFQIEGSDVIYKIPLAASMPARLILFMNEADKRDEVFEAQMAMLREYMGEDADEITTNTALQILEAWSDESMKQGATAGESQALSD